MPFTAIADQVFILVIFAILVLTLTAGCTKEALLALATAAHARRVMGIINTTKVTSNLSPTAGNASLVNSFMLAKL